MSEVVPFGFQSISIRSSFIWFWIHSSICRTALRLLSDYVPIHSGSFRPFLGRFGLVKILSAFTQCYMEARGPLSVSILAHIDIILPSPICGWDSFGTHSGCSRTSSVLPVTCFWTLCFFVINRIHSACIQVVMNLHDVIQSRRLHSVFYRPQSGPFRLHPIL